MAGLYRLLYLSKSFSIGDLGYVRLTNAILLGYKFLLYALTMKFFYSLNIVKGKHGLSAYTRYISSLRYHIPDIVLVRSKKQMVGIHASRIIAGMKDMKISRITEVYFTRQPVGFSNLTVKVDLPISRLVQRALPEPAIFSISRLHVREESLRNRAASRIPMMRQKTQGFAFYPFLFPVCVWCYICLLTTPTLAVSIHDRLFPSCYDIILRTLYHREYRRAKP